MIMFKRADGEIVQPQPYAPKGSLPKKGGNGQKPEAKAEKD